MMSLWAWGKRRQNKEKETARKTGQGQKYVQRNGGENNKLQWEKAKERYLKKKKYSGS